jgi:hypothetical protein
MWERGVEDPGGRKYEAQYGHVKRYRESVDALQRRVLRLAYAERCIRIRGLHSVVIEASRHRLSSVLFAS